jgi:hypothetical protein
MFQDDSTGRFIYKMQIYISKEYVGILRQHHKKIQQKATGQKPTLITSICTTNGSVRQIT